MLMALIDVDGAWVTRPLSVLFSTGFTQYPFGEGSENYFFIASSSVEDEWEWGLSAFSLPLGGALLSRVRERTEPRIFAPSLPACCCLSRLLTVDGPWQGLFWLKAFMITVESHA